MFDKAKEKEEELSTLYVKNGLRSCHDKWTDWKNSSFLKI